MSASTSLRNSLVAGVLSRALLAASLTSLSPGTGAAQTVPTTISCLKWCSGSINFHACMERCSAKPSQEYEPPQAPGGQGLYPPGLGQARSFWASGTVPTLGMESEHLVDSLAAWAAAGSDSEEQMAADVVFVTGDWDIRIEADSTFADLDTSDLATGVVDRLPYRAMRALTTVGVHRRGGNADSNPRSAATLVLHPLAEQPLAMTVLHRARSGERVTLRYVGVDVAPGAILALALAADAIEFPLRVDLDGDGSVDDVRYPVRMMPAVNVAQGRNHAPGILSCGPNPFALASTIAFDLPTRAHVRLEVYTAAGRLAATLFDGPADPGRHEIVWDGLLASGARAPAGAYFCRLVGRGAATSRLIVIVK